MSERSFAGRRSLPLGDVTITDGFWAPRAELVRTVTLPHQRGQMERSGYFEALDLDWRPGQEPVPHVFWESDLGKWIEAASHALAAHPDPELERTVDEAIERLAGAQQPDGYLNVHFTVVEPGRRFTNLRDCHELYCAGHLIEAAVAHFAATGKRSLLDVMCRYADLIVEEFGPGGRHEGGYDGHEEIELALVKLHRLTGDRRYLELGCAFVEARGRRPFYFDGDELREYNQSHLPVREQREVVGHAVRATYLYSAMADVAAETSDASLWAACERLWEHLTTTRLYVTGGVGSSPANEGFTADYDLPAHTGYAETCAAIGLVLWAQRMSHLSGEARYVDVLELALYNGVLSGLSEDGRHFFYVNPLASDGSVSRQEWFECACCPPNLARLVASLGAYLYAASDDELVVDLFVGSRARARLRAGGVTVEQATDYPWDGRVSIVVTPDEEAEFAVAVRLPQWCAEPALAVNGAPVDVGEVRERGYARLVRRWTAGDRIELDLPMPVSRTWADPRVASAAGRVALTRGPLVYCFEGVDNEGPLHALALPRAATVQPTAAAVPGVVALVAGGTVAAPDARGDDLYRREAPAIRETPLVAVPYHAWNNRGPAPMLVWIRETS